MTGIRALLPLCLLLLAAACDTPGKRRGAGAQEVPPFAYADGQEGLRRLWTDILTACQKDDRNRVHDLMASLALTEQELQGLFGRERAGALWPRYQMLIGTLANTGAIELVAQVLEKKYDDVAVVSVDAQPAAEQQTTDLAVRRALVRPLPLYTVRVKRKTEPKGLRYDFFVYLDGRWRTGNLLGKYMEPASPASPPRN